MGCEKQDRFSEKNLETKVLVHEVGARIRKIDFYIHFKNLFCRKWGSLFRFSSLFCGPLIIKTKFYTVDRYLKIFYLTVVFLLFRRLVFCAMVYNTVFGICSNRYVLHFTTWAGAWRNGAGSFQDSVWIQR